MNCSRSSGRSRLITGKLTNVQYVLLLKSGSPETPEFCSESAHREVPMIATSTLSLHRDERNETSPLENVESIGSILARLLVDRRLGPIPVSSPDAANPDESTGEGRTAAA